MSTGLLPETDVSLPLNMVFLLHQVVSASLRITADSSFIISVPSQMIFAIIGLYCIIDLNLRNDFSIFEMFKRFIIGIFIVLWT